MSQHLRAVVPARIGRTPVPGACLGSTRRGLVDIVATMDAALNKLLRSSKKRDAVLLAFVTDNSPGQVALPARILKDTSVDSMVARNDVVTAKLSSRPGDDGDVLMRMRACAE